MPEKENLTRALAADELPSEANESLPLAKNVSISDPAAPTQATGVECRSGDDTQVTEPTIQAPPPITLPPAGQRGSGKG